MRLESRVFFIVGVLALASAACWSQSAHAWGPRGHHIVARLAEKHLTPAARAEVQKLLALRGVHYLDQIADWADDLRDTEPALFRRTRRLHFINFQSSDCRYDAARDCRDGKCVVAAINRYSAILANHAQSPAARAEALAFVVHFVGDVHQPLHAGYRHDAGGNDFQVRWRGRGSNLHRVWDSLMIDSRRLPAGKYVAKLERENEKTQVVVGGTPAEWAEESCRVDRDGGVYPASRNIDQAYVERELPIVDQRLWQAGLRLAALLNRDLGAPH